MCELLHTRAKNSTIDKGVLRIRLPKPAEVAKKQQKIEIKKD
jgi:HSP20 family molecular chaperone IbpA